MSDYRDILNGVRSEIMTIAPTHNEASVGSFDATIRKVNVSRDSLDDVDSYASELGLGDVALLDYGQQISDIQGRLVNAQVTNAGGEVSTTPGGVAEVGEHLNEKNAALNNAEALSQQLKTQLAACKATLDEIEAAHKAAYHYAGQASAAATRVSNIIESYLNTI